MTDPRGIEDEEVARGDQRRELREEESAEPAPPAVGPVACRAVGTPLPRRLLCRPSARPHRGTLDQRSARTIRVGCPAPPPARCAISSGGSSKSKSLRESAGQPSKIVACPAGGVMPKRRYASAVAHASARGALQKSLLHQERLVHFLRACPASSPTATASVASPTGPPPNFSMMVVRIRASMSSSPNSSTLSRASACVGHLERDVARRPAPARSRAPGGAGGSRPVACRGSAGRSRRRLPRRSGTSRIRAERVTIFARSSDG